MTQFLGQEVSQKLDCKDNQNDNDGCQDGHIVIVAVKSCLLYTSSHFGHTGHQYFHTEK